MKSPGWAVGVSARASDPLADENRSSEDLAHAMRGLAAGPLNVATLKRIGEIAAVLAAREAGNSVRQHEDRGSA